MASKVLTNPINYGIPKETNPPIASIAAQQALALDPARVYNFYGFCVDTGAGAQVLESLPEGVTYITSIWIGLRATQENTEVQVRTFGGGASLGSQQLVFFQRHYGCRPALLDPGEDNYGWSDFMQFNPPIAIRQMHPFAATPDAIGVTLDSAAPGDRCNFVIFGYNDPQA